MSYSSSTSSSSSSSAHTWSYSGSFTFRTFFFIYKKIWILNIIWKEQYKYKFQVILHFWVAWMINTGTFNNWSIMNYISMLFSLKISLLNCGLNVKVSFCSRWEMKELVRIKVFKEEKRHYLQPYWRDKGLKGTVVNWECTTLRSLDKHDNPFNEENSRSWRDIFFKFSIWRNFWKKLF